MSNAGAGGALPTGCYKCGRPGHWSRDCPSDPNPNPNPNPNPRSDSASTAADPKSHTNNLSHSGGFSKNTFQAKTTPAEKPKKVPKIRPKLTPELLLSDEGIGYILRYFPKNFKYRGRGHEVSDLRNLLRMYADWHSQLLPYFPFDQFIHKVEDISSSRRVRTCIGELKDRVANGGDPTKLKEAAPETEVVPNTEDPFSTEEPANHEDDLFFNDNGPEDMEEDILNDIFNKTPQEASHSAKANTVASNTPLSEKAVENSDKVSGSSSNPLQITQEQKTLMEAKRLKALERAAARSRLLSPS